MSNHLTFQYTIFENIYPTGESMEKNYGYRIYDNYGTEYCNTFESLDELNDKFYIDEEPNIPEIFKAIRSYERFECIDNDVVSALDINGTVYDWDKITELFPKEFEWLSE